MKIEWKIEGKFMKIGEKPCESRKNKKNEWKFLKIDIKPIKN